MRYFLLSLLLPAFLFAQPVSQAERQRFEEIRARHDKGEAVSPEDRQFAQGIMQRMNQQQAAAKNTDWAKAHPARESTGLVPLPDLVGKTYQGEEGGLYPGGKNTPPEAHLKEGLRLAKSIAATDGKIVFLTIGMSNTTQETQAFQKLAARDPEINPKLVIVDGAQGGQTARITADPNANYWKVVDERLAEAGVTRNQVQVAWIKQANAQPSQGWPAATRQLQADLVATIHNLRDKFPNLKIAYLSSRIYGGYASTPLNPEPYAYEGGFAVKWTIAQQLSGDPSLKTPWLAWGPYLWADGVKGGWTRDDLGPDGTHPSDAGRLKVGRMLLEFLKKDPISAPWFR
jgi:lysophospholipase L1-like esterase